MGVHKLWDILLTIAIPKRIQDLSGLILAIDASLWIVKVNSIYQNIDEGLKCIFNKLLWLKKNNIKPIFVFDGQTPMLKRRTIQDRRNRRKQANQFDITKKVQIQIVKKVSGVQSQKSQADSTAYDQKSKQLDQILNNLLKYSNTTNTIQLSQKISLQAEVLNKKYQLFSQILPKLTQKYGAYDYFNSLDIQTKQQILQDIQTNEMPSRRDVRMLRQTLSEQQKIMYDMQLIKKKSKIRQLQDNLYRKMMTKKIQNGYEIIQGVYNGKKVIQKRRVKQKSFDEWAFKGNNRKQTCNNFKQIFQKNKKVNQSQLSQPQQDDDKNPNFFSKIFNKNYNEQRRQSSLSTFQQLSQRLSQSTSNRNNQNYKRTFSNNQINYRKQKSNSYQQQQNQQIQYDNIFDQVEPKNQDQNKKSLPIQTDPDNFPDYIMMQKLDQLNTSSHNIHLQNMLDILGINYIIAPYQAQAQCAALEQMGLVDGIVTEDSDSFLFGARKVYRGVFQDNIKLYSMSKVQQKLFLTRQKLILFALMLGSDYTDGVKGIGIVNAMQILKVHHDIESLTKFTQWAKSSDILLQNQQFTTENMLQSAMSEDEKQFYKLHRKFKNYWHVHPSFPQKNIYDAYMQPDIQQGEKLQNKIKQNKKLESDALKKMMEQKWKMVPMQIEMNMKIFTKPFEKKTQTQITDYAQGGFAKIVSKRLQKAINRDYNN